MDIYILWGFLFLGLLLFIMSLRKPPITLWLLAFFIKAYFTIFLGVLAVERNMLEYPVRFLPDYFNSSLLFEYLLFPTVCVYFYQNTYQARFSKIIIHAIFYAAAITIIEVFLEEYTQLIVYHSWTWFYSFCSLFLLMLLVRGLMEVIQKIALKRE